MYHPRSLEHWLNRTLETRPLVYLNGPRQGGKTTLVKTWVKTMSIHILVLIHRSSWGP